jgi:hypothetical protein
MRAFVITNLPETSPVAFLKTCKLVAQVHCILRDDVYPLRIIDLVGIAGRLFERDVLIAFFATRARHNGNGNQDCRQEMKHIFHYRTRHAVVGFRKNGLRQGIRCSALTIRKLVFQGGQCFRSGDRRHEELRTNDYHY